MKNTLLLVDYKNMLMRSIFANQMLSYKGVFTGGLYGFINMLASLVERHGIDCVVVCKDKKPYHRSTVWPQYKQNRAELNEHDSRLIGISEGQVNDLLFFLKLTVASEQGWEADDIIGQYCKIRNRNYDRIFISSTDSDLYQLFAYAKHIYLCKQEGRYGIQQFRKDYPKLKPWQWPRLCALKGSHNGVEGIPRVGEKTALKLLLEGVSNRQLQERYKVAPKDIKCRTELSTFPFPSIVPGPALPNPKTPRYTRPDMIRYLAQYGITLTPVMDSAFERLSRASLPKAS